MAVLSINIPDAVAPRVRAAFAANFGWQPMIPGPGGSTVPNPEPLPQFMARKTREWVRAVVVNHEAFLAAKSAQETARNAAEAEIVLS